MSAIVIVDRGAQSRFVSIDNIPESCAREYFVSQTPELTAMADAVIDLDGMEAGVEPVAPEA